MHPYRSWSYVIARDGRSAGLQAQASTVSGRVARAPRRAPFPACVSSYEELTIDSRLLLHCNRSRCVMLDNASILVCEVESVEKLKAHGPLSLPTAGRHTGENRQRMLITFPLFEGNNKKPNSLATSFFGRLYMHSQ